MTTPNAAKIKSQDKLLSWYKEAKRPLPWRKNRDPYRIWISEVMLQQTTVAAVIPFFERFMSRFPNVDTLANSKIEDVLEHWSGLGYYSRARNLHKSAQFLQSEHKGKFPKSFAELLELPGFGPYTSRAVSSLAFSEKVGVLDGNVIRVLCRVYGLGIEWWKTSERLRLQLLADELAQHSDPASINQALMELGATICTPQKTLCSLCPWSTQCQARKEDLVQSLPLKKPRKKMEAWLWQPLVLVRNNKIALTKEHTAPVLSDALLLPGPFRKISRPPQRFDLKHSITHHNIYIQLQRNVKSKGSATEGLQWIAISKLKQKNPSSLLQKVLLKHSSY